MTHEDRATPPKRPINHDGEDRQETEYVRKHRREELTPPLRPASTAAANEPLFPACCRSLNLPHLHRCRSSLYHQRLRPQGWGSKNRQPFHQLCIGVNSPQMDQLWV